MERLGRGGNRQISALSARIREQYGCTSSPKKIKTVRNDFGNVFGNRKVGLDSHYLCESPELWQGEDWKEGRLEWRDDFIWIASVARRIMAGFEREGVEVRLTLRQVLPRRFVRGVRRFVGHPLVGTFHGGL